MSFEFGGELILGEIAPPFEDDLMDVDAEGAADAAPAFPEFPAADGDGFVPGAEKVDDRRFHGPGTGGCQNINVLFRAEDVLDALGHFHEESREFRRSVVDNGLGGGR